MSCPLLPAGELHCLRKNCLLSCREARSVSLRVQGMEAVHSAAAAPQSDPASARSVTAATPVASAQQDVDMDRAGDSLLAHEALAPAHLDGSCGEAPPAPPPAAHCAAVPLWESRPAVSVAGTSLPRASAGAKTASAQRPAVPSAFAMPQTSRVQLFAPPTGATGAYCWA
jgi:hypothetical protein